jgi:hypothetical protein
MNPEHPDEVQVPADLPQLSSETGAPSGANIIRYQRRADHGVQLTSVQSGTEVIVIDEDTPTPPMPQRQAYIPVHRRRPEADGEVLYIGPE